VRVAAPPRARPLYFSPVQANARSPCRLSSRLLLCVRDLLAVFRLTALGGWPDTDEHRGVDEGTAHTDVCSTGRART